ncbi:MAG: PKD domain-containing protein [Thermoplasmata archaeon]|nr:MAG: PKD domain-containing protein [Thermoplasmata archaeon]
MMVLLCLVALAAMALVTSAADGDLNLTSAQYVVSDDDSDGFADTVTVTATVHNGNMLQSKAFTLEVLLMEGANQVDLKTDGALLGANASMNVTLSVGTDIDSPKGTYNVSVQLHDGDLTGEVVATDEYSADLHPRGEYSVSVVADRTTAETLENTSVDFTLTVSSLSNNPTGVDINVTTNLGWSYDLQATFVQLEGGESIDVDMTVHVPRDAPAGSREVLTVEVRSTRNGTAFATTSVSVTVAMQTFGVDMSLDIDQVFVASGDTVTVQGTVSNEGNNADNITLMAETLPGWTAEFVPPSLLLSRGESGRFTLHLTPPPSLKESGTSQMNVTALSSGLVASATGVLTVIYNTAEISLRGDIEISPALPVSGEDVTLQAPVLNNGSVVAENILVVVISDGVELARTFIDSIPPRGTGVATLTWTAAPGSQLLRVVVDPDNDIPETDETNNEAVWTLGVTSANLAVFTTDMSISPSYPTEGTDATITVIVNNLAQQPAGPFDVILSVEGEQLKAFTVELGLAGGANVTLEATWTALAGRFEFTVDVDPLGQVPEEDRTNNQASRSFSANARPTAALLIHMTELEEGESTFLNADESFDVDGRVRQYFYDYGDGTDSGWVFSSGINHTYGQAGTYEVRLYVRDEAGAQNEEPSMVEITVIKPDDGPGESTPALPTPLVLAALMLSAVLLALATRRGTTGMR